jgi:hypothetical protein
MHPLTLSWSNLDVGSISWSRALVNLEFLLSCESLFVFYGF